MKYVCKRLTGRIISIQEEGGIDLSLTRSELSSLKT